MPKEAQDIVKGIIEVANTKATMQEFLRAFETALKALSLLKAANLAEREQLKASVDSMLTMLEERFSTLLDEEKSDFRDISASVNKSLATVQKAITKLELRTALIKDGEPGKDAVVDVPAIVSEVLAALPPDAEEKADKYRDLLESLKGDERLDASAVKNLPEFVRETATKAGWGAHPLKIMDGTTTIDKVARVINFGSNLTATRSKDGVVTINASGGGGGFSVVAVTGTIDDSNTSFSSASEPTLLCINGAFYQSTGGAITFTYLAGTITTSSPVGAGGSIFGIA